ncbi:hypothetical protein pb186bvf_020867 [Paramecium bursaria]
MRYKIKVQCHVEEINRFQKFIIVNFDIKKSLVQYRRIKQILKKINKYQGQIFS